MKRGEEVAKTARGRANSGQKATPPNGMSDRNKFKPQVVFKGDLRQLFRPDEMFKIKRPGVYELEVRMRLCMVMTNGILDFEAMTNMHKFGFAPASSFGVITSPPVRVQVIKD